MMKVTLYKEDYSEIGWSEILKSVSIAEREGIKSVTISFKAEDVRIN